jgi:hypothetical protein
MIINDAKCTCEMKSRIAMAKAESKKIKVLFPSNLDLNLRKSLVKCYFWSVTFYAAENLTLRTVDQKYLEKFEKWCWTRKEKISRPDHVRNEVFYRVFIRREISYMQ